ncbi:unnamed protein product [Miscanthus lutarioriparius]|uniref:Protein kinase domain-containing protein n=1 Tax=Miscanthus lutarioriparius TaxID=422564 RepID=A0A811Q7J7_9POAL|nr:unnamed protein product [Miscanthus lutarioriparius]
MDDFEHIRMTYKSLKQITGDFSTVIGRGPFGVVYEGQGSGTQELAVKVLDSSAGVGGQEDLDRFVRVLAKVFNKWRTRLQAIPGYTTLDTDCQQVKTCIEIALECIAEERNKRPTIGDIVEQLNLTEKMEAVRNLRTFAPYIMQSKLPHLKFAFLVQY